MKLFFKFSNISRFTSRRSYSVKNSYDICIVGGGPVGFGFASILSSCRNLQSCRILLLESEKSRPFIGHNDFSNRTVALSPVTREILEGCGAWKTIDDHRFNTVKKMFIWEQTSDSFITFHNEDSNPDMAYIVENDLLQHSIVKTLSNKSNVEVRYDAKVADIDFQSPDVTVTLGDGSQVSASLIVGADGFKSRVREKAGIKFKETKYDQKAIVSVVNFEPDANDHKVAWQRFTRNGPIAYLPLDSSHSSLIWSTTAQEADRLMKLNDEEFINSLNNEMFTDEYQNKYLSIADKIANRAIGLFPNSFIDESDRCKHRQLPPKVISILPKSRATFPLGFMHATNYVGHNVALIGDAAHRILPLAGQGVNLGFGDASLLAKCISEGSSVGESIGNLRRLQQYESERQRYVLPVAATIQILHHLYYSKFFLAMLSRSVTLKLANVLSPMKKMFVHGATRGKIDIVESLLK